MKKILTIVGARPQFIKSNILSKELKENFKEILVHTGQHYDENMSNIFFDELKMKRPDYNLGVGSNTHAKQTAEIMVKIEEVIEKEKPDAVLLYGDTNSTLAGAVVAAKLLIPIFHVEGGLRTHCLDQPEEQNRIVTDHLSSLVFVSTLENLDEAKRENLTEKSILVGDIMYDSIKFYTKMIEDEKMDKMFLHLKPLYISDIKITSKNYYFLTLHRPENTDNINTLKEILNVMEKLENPILFAVHPRIRKKVDKLIKKKNYKNFYFVEPLSYLETLYFTKNAKKVVTDSGGLHKEAYLHGVPCVTILRGGWKETEHHGWNHFVPPTEKKLLEKIKDTNIDWNAKRDEFGTGEACKKIVKEILKYFKEKENV